MKKKVIIFLPLIIISFLVLYLIVNFNKQQKDFTKAIPVQLGLYDQQNQADKLIQEASENLDYTITNPKVILNPYQISPLTALIIFNTSAETEIEVTINNGQVITFPKTKKHIIPIYGLKPDYHNQIKISNQEQSHLLEITTQKVPERYKTMEVIQSSNKIGDDLFLITSPMGDAAAAYNPDGTIGWYLSENYYFTPKVLDNGHLLLGNGEVRDKYGSSTGFIEIDLLGKIHNEYRFLNGYHHYITTLDNNYLLASNNTNFSSYFDNIVLMTPEGKILKTWDLYEIIKKIDASYTQNLDEVWAWINSVIYDEKNNSLIISLRGRNSIISIDYNTSEINWIFGSINDWSDKFTSYFLKVTPNSKLPQGQHSVFLTNEGYLGFYNNGFQASDADKIVTCTELETNYSSLGIYQINDKNINQIWHYSKDFFSYALSNFKILDNHHKLMLSGWEIKAPNNCQNISDYPIQARIIELDQNDNLIFEGIIPQGKFNVEKLKLYTPSTKTINFNSINIYNNLNNGQKLEHIPSLIKNAPKRSFGYNVNTNRFEVNGLYPYENEIKLYFISEKETSLEFLIKEKNSNIMFPLILEGLNGKYHLYLSENDNFYDTKVVLEFTKEQL